MWRCYVSNVNTIVSNYDLTLINGKYYPHMLSPPLIIYCPQVNVFTLIVAAVLIRNHQTCTGRLSNINTRVKVFAGFRRQPRKP